VPGDEPVGEGELVGDAGGSDGLLLPVGKLGLVLGGTPPDGFCDELDWVDFVVFAAGGRFVSRCCDSVRVADAVEEVGLRF
jgi:hypothetical protein